MFRILVFGHADFAEGLTCAAMQISGGHAALWAINTLPDDSLAQLSTRLQVVLGETEDAVIVLCDMAGGAPWRAAMETMRSRSGGVLAGANLPMLLELLALCDGDVALDMALERGRQAGIEGIQ